MLISYHHILHAIKLLAKEFAFDKILFPLNESAVGAGAYLAATARRRRREGISRAGLQDCPTSDRLTAGFGLFLDRIPIVAWGTPLPYGRGSDDLRAHDRTYDRRRDREGAVRLTVREISYQLSRSVSWSSREF